MDAFCLGPQSSELRVSRCNNPILQQAPGANPQRRLAAAAANVTAAAAAANDDGDNGTLTEEK